jgi:predicted aconitase with swiveling domain
MATIATDSKTATKTYHGRPISKGKCEGEALVTRLPLSLMGSVLDLTTGVVQLGGHDLEGKSMKDKILVYDTDYMSTSGCFGLLNMVQVYHCGPKGIIWRDAHNICANAAIYAGIPAMDRLKEGAAWELIKTGDWVRIDADRGIVEVVARS